MNIQDLTESELRQRANDCMSGFEGASSSEKQDRLAEAQFCLAELERRDQAAERKHTRWIEPRDLVLELVIIFLISWEIRFAHTEGKAQLEVLNNLQTSSAATAEVLKDVRKSQASATSAIQSQLGLSEKTRDTLRTQLDVTKREQALVSRQLAIQQNALAKQRRAPVVELRAYHKTPKKIGGEYKLIPPGAASLLGYPARSLDDGRSQEITMIFLVRNIGTAPILNLSPHVRAPGTFKIKCLGFSGLLSLSGELPEECSAPIAKIPPIEPIPKESPVPTPQRGPGPDFVFQAVLVGPRDTPQFDISVELFADNLQPIYYRIQYMPWLEFSPYAE